MNLGPSGEALAGDLDLLFDKHLSQRAPSEAHAEQRAGCSSGRFHIMESTIDVMDGRDRGGKSMSRQGSYTFDELAEQFELRPNEPEGTLLHETLRNRYSSVVVALTGGEYFSAIHRDHATNVYHFYGGAPREFLMLHPDGRVTTPILGSDYRAGHVPQLVVPAGVWEGSRSTGEWTLTGGTMAPGWRAEGFEMGDRRKLTAEYPAVSERIRDLTR